MLEDQGEFIVHVRGRGFNLDALPLFLAVPSSLTTDPSEGFAFLVLLRIPALEKL